MHELLQKALLTAGMRYNPQDHYELVERCNYRTIAYYLAKVLTEQNICLVEISEADEVFLESLTGE